MEGWDLLIPNMFQTGLLERATDAAMMRNEAISQNIANVDTPNYKKKVVRFEEYLESAQGLQGNRTDPRHIPIGKADPSALKPQMMEGNSWGVSRLDQNDVDIHVEMAQLAQNQIKYNVLIERLNGSLRNLRSVINDGR
jgi:flagellar basal-body rod protein FlgB